MIGLTVAKKTPLRGAEIFGMDLCGQLFMSSCDHTEHELLRDFPNKCERNMHLNLCTHILDQHIDSHIFIPILAASNWTHWCLSLFVCGCIISWVFVYVKVPKTKGMPLEVIIEFFAIGAKPGADPATMAS
ncbi:hypothetical protein HN51_045252 [Arachis hypogaea]